MNFNRNARPGRCRPLSLGRGLEKFALVAPALCGGLLLCAGCAGLPPKPAPATLSEEAPLSEPPSGGAAAWPAEDWWKQYRDPALDALIGLAIESSPTLASAHARFESARQSVRIASAASGAHLEASSDFSRQRLSDNGLFAPSLLGFDWYDQADLGLQASYTFDWWGKQRQTVEAAMDEAHASQAERSAAALVLTSSIADSYFGWQADQARLQLARQHEATLEHERAISEARIRADLDPKDDEQRADAALAQVREQIAALEGSAELRVIALAALADRAPAQLPRLTVRPLPSVAAAIPDDVRIDLVSRRADIVASRWRVEAAEHGRESARAEFFPDISINALVGFQSMDVGTLLHYGSRVPAAAAAIHLPIFDAGRLKARYGAAQAAVESAVASYRDTVVGAARDVATQASSLEQIAAQRAQRQRGLDAAQTLERSAAARVRQGVVDPRVELGAAETLIEQREALVELDAAAVSADIGLKRALGGGYEMKAAP
ncbi:MAG TPA: efflux transporter outer membrane subunit [Steroidobacteraceae bacterium]|jgi:multidrug efflux system outer membrane protein|nr:efflux transporter outer membrane subunit [Steroidobacteraceae bacterium]